MNDEDLGEPTRTYESADVVVEWRDWLCKKCHACADGLPEVFDPGRKPWVDLSRSDAESVILQVGKCPSKALTCKRK